MFDHMMCDLWLYFGRLPADEAGETQSQHVHHPRLAADHRGGAHVLRRHQRREVHTLSGFLQVLEVLEIHQCFFKAMKSLKNSTFLIGVLTSP